MANHRFEKITVTQKIQYIDVPQIVVFTFEFTVRSFMIICCAVREAKRLDSTELGYKIMIKKYALCNPLQIYFLSVRDCSTRLVACFYSSSLKPQILGTINTISVNTISVNTISIIIQLYIGIHRFGWPCLQEHVSNSLQVISQLSAYWKTFCS